MAIPGGDRSPDGADDIRDLTVHRVLTAVAALSVLWGAESSFGAGSHATLIGVASVVGFMGAIAVVIGATLAPSSRALFRFDVALLVLSLIVLCAWVASDLLANSSYRTDEEIFVQYGAHLLSQGKNPYGVDMTPAFQMFPLPPQQFTPLMNGHYPADMGYPALPMLLTWVANAFTGGFHTVIVLNLVAAFAATVLAFLMLPTRFRPLGVILTVGMPGLVLHVQFGFIQVLMLPFLLAASWNWTSTGRGGRLGRTGWARAVCYGLAISIQQLAWFTLPFVVVGLYLLRRGEIGRRATVRVTLRYVGIAATTFLLVNAPFIATAPSAWLHGIMEPLTQHAIPMGNGLIGLTQTLEIGSGDLQYYSTGALLLLITLLLAYALYFRVLGSALFVLPFMGLLFSSRSLAAYFVPLAVLWGVSLVSADRAAFAETPRLFDTRFSPRTRKLFVAVSALPAFGFLLLATTASAPLKVQVVSTNTIPALHLVQQMTVKVTNTSGDPLTPHFLTSSSSLAASNFWDATGGPETLAPHQTATYTLTGTSQASMYFASDDFKVMAVTDSPASVSWSPLHRTVSTVAYMDSSPGNAAHQPGTDVTLTVQVRDATTNKAVHTAGLQINLQQTVYGVTGGISAAGTSVNGSHDNIVSATTDANGTATFTVRSDTATPSPVFYQASIKGRELSFSAAVPVWWH